MALDFSVLHDIKMKVAIEDFSEPYIDTSLAEAGNYSLDKIKPSKGQNRGVEEHIHTHVLDHKKRERAQAKEMFNTYQTNIKRSEKLRADILKGMKRGEAPPALLLKAIECISLMTGDSLLYRQGKEDMLSIYGWGLKEPTLLQEELREAQERLQQLSKAEAPPEDKKRIERAIQEHRELIAHIEKTIESGEE